MKKRFKPNLKLVLFWDKLSTFIHYLVRTKDATEFFQASIGILTFVFILDTPLIELLKLFLCSVAAVWFAIGLIKLFFEIRSTIKRRGRR